MLFGRFGDRARSLLRAQGKNDWIKIEPYVTLSARAAVRCGRETW